MTALWTQFVPFSHPQISCYSVHTANLYLHIPLHSRSICLINYQPELLFIVFNRTLKQKLSERRPCHFLGTDTLCVPFRNELRSGCDVDSSIHLWNTLHPSIIKSLSLQDFPVFYQLWLVVNHLTIRTFHPVEHQENTRGRMGEIRERQRCKR